MCNKVTFVLVCIHGAIFSIRIVIQHAYIVLYYVNTVFTHVYAMKIDHLAVSSRNSHAIPVHKLASRAHQETCYRICGVTYRPHIVKQHAYIMFYHVSMMFRHVYVMKIYRLAVSSWDFHAIRAHMNWLHERTKRYIFIYVE